MSLRVLYVSVVVTLIQSQDLGDTLGEMIQKLQSIQQSLLPNQQKQTATTTVQPMVPGVQDVNDLFEEFDRFKGIVLRAVQAEKLSRVQIAERTMHLEGEFDRLTKQDTQITASVAEVGMQIQTLRGNVTDLAQIEQVLTEAQSQPAEQIECKKLSKQMSDLTATVEAFDEQIRAFRVYFAAINIALLKPASQSSTYEYYEAEAAVDGNTSQLIYNYLCSHTLHEYNPWWMVDFEADYAVGRVIIYNREDCCGERLRDFVLTLSRNSTGDDSVTFGKFEGASYNGEVIIMNNLARPVGRFLKVQIVGQGILTICEIQVFSMV